ncbi:oxidoreductase [Acrocarpospora pleiomorpha]|uniref:Probable nitronate monooxygenase n=1 Tax=Acrocarpospora pleiomorpha TaxID=90975 RepID=A0A5M3XB15_9ACTN|nr:nitronate monooxygenase [Acrocarpospora pleiomorpha]GES17399.1 oxidoreductase [Acrocarpospora pleiomorpha]
MDLQSLRYPIIQAPMAGGPSTPELAAAVSGAGGLGFLAAGYRTVAELRADIAAVRARTEAPFGVNLFVPGTGPRPEETALETYAERLRPDAERYGVRLGDPVADDDGWAEKLALVAGERVPVVSFVFGLPGREVVEELRRAGALVLVTVTTPAEAVAAWEGGADALVAQGVEAGGHRGGFTDEGDLGLLALLRLVARHTPLPVVGAGGVMDHAGVAAVLAAGAVAAQLGTAFLLCPEAGTSQPYRAALASASATALTRAFTGRLARGLVNRFLAEHSAYAPAAYPQIHRLTAPLRAAARRAGDAEMINLWAGQGFALARDTPAAELVRELGTGHTR